MDTNQPHHYPPQPHPSQSKILVPATLSLVGIVIFVALVSIYGLPRTTQPPRQAAYQVIVDDLRATGVPIPGPGGDATAVISAANAICQHQGTRQYLVNEGVQHRFTYRQINTLIDSSVRNLCPNKQFIR